MDKKKVMVRNMMNHPVGIYVPSMNFKRDFPRKDATLPIDFEILQEIMYDPGVEYMFKQGILYIEDMEVKRELGLEPYDAEEPEEIIVLNDGQRRRLLTVASLEELKETCEKLSYEQNQELANYAILNELGDLERAKIIKQFTEVDIIRAIQNRKDPEEEK